MVRKYSSLSLIIISFLLFIYYFTNHVENSSSRLSYNNNDIYSYFKFQSSNSDNISTNIPTHDILLVLRTSKNLQSVRIPVILKTWFQFSPETTYITTNGDIKNLYRFLPKEYHHQIHVTKCNQSHTIRDLCCHSGSEFDVYFQNKYKYKWLCRFDDDQYVNVPLLIDYLKQFYPDKQPLYIGKPSLKEPKQGRGIQFWFATYGGGVCYSRSLLQKIRNDIQPSNRFMKGCISTNYPDDTHIAYILRTKYNINLTVANDFHHHIEGDLFTNLTNPSNIDQAITLGFKANNVPRFLPLIDHDRYHMQTLHCLLYPDRNCMRLLRILLNKLYEEKYG
jgi:fringe protein